MIENVLFIDFEIFLFSIKVDCFFITYFVTFMLLLNFKIFGLSFFSISSSEKDKTFFVRADFFIDFYDKEIIGEPIFGSSFSFYFYYFVSLDIESYFNSFPEFAFNSFFC